MSRDVLTLRVAELIPSTPGARIVRLALGNGSFEYRAGQAALVGVHGQPLRKPYSIAGAPQEARRHRRLEFLFRIEPAGETSPHLEGVGAGALIDVEGPLGSFHFPETPAERRFLFIAGGTGIAPLRAMLWDLLLDRRGLPRTERDRESIALVYSARSPRDFAYAEELRVLAAEGRIALRMTVTRDGDRDWTGDRGRIDRERLAPLVTDPATLCFVCGPESLVETIVPLLRGLGIAQQRIRTEGW